MIEQEENTAAGSGLEIAVIGMAGRFPGAKNIDEFWENLKNGVESVTFFTHEELEAAGVKPDQLEDPNYVKTSGGLLENKEYFDASFFGFSAREAEALDPQMRVFHEIAWEALEQAGYALSPQNKSIGLYAGASDDFEWKALCALSGKAEMLGAFALSLLTDKDYLCTRVSYNLDLKGPSAAVKTACSTSLVAVHMACQGLLNGECDLALAGGITVRPTKGFGYLYQEGMTASPDGHCRAFDEKSKGFIGGEGVGIVVLKVLEDALADRDYIHAVIKGTAINNDGNRKAGFTAPSVIGQMETIRMAHKVADIEPESISYIETHGTGTNVGDPIEIEALKMAFNTEKKKFCALGSVKTNIGHLDAAAGVVGLIKTILALKHRLIPSSLHYEKPNPKIDFENSPFYVNTTLKKWQGNGAPLRAGVSSFGIGGTNAHVILEEWPGGPSSNARRTEQEAREMQLILLSARTPTGLEKMTQNLVEYFKNSLLNHGNHGNPVNPGLTLADAAYTLQVGRKTFPHRRMLVCSTIEQTIAALTSPASGMLHTYHWKPGDKEKDVIFMFPGQGSQYVDMGLELYRTERIFREEIDRCFEILKPLMGYDIKEILYPRDSVSEVSEEIPTGSPVAKNNPATRDSQPATSTEKINETELAQPLLFAFEYALAKLVMKWGIKPDAMIGHSIGEYTAACLSGVFSLQDALRLVVLRGRLMQQMPAGAMLSVSLDEDSLAPYLNNELSIAAVNTFSACVVSGPHPAINNLSNRLKEKGHETRLLHTSHAFHSRMMEPVLKKFEEALLGHASTTCLNLHKKNENSYQIKLNPPQIPYISNVTGGWAASEEATSPAYWARQLRSTVRFYDSLNLLLKKQHAIFVEIGPGKALSTFVRQHRDRKPAQLAVNLIPHPREKVADDYYLLNKIGQLWLYGVAIDWKEFYGSKKEKKYRIPLPTYPFEHQRYVIEGDPLKMAAQMMAKKSLSAKRADIGDWFYIPSWKRSRWAADKTWQNKAPSNWLVLIDESHLGIQLINQLEKMKRNVVMVRIGTNFHKVSPCEYSLDPGKADNYFTLFSEMTRDKSIPGCIVHMWGTANNTIPNEEPLAMERIDYTLDLGYYSLLNMTCAMGRLNISQKIQIMVVTTDAQEVLEEDKLDPLKTTVIGAVKAIPKEYNNIKLRSIDVKLPQAGGTQEEKLLQQLLNECVTQSTETVMAFRDNQRWLETYEPIRLEVPQSNIPPLRKGGVYLVTGGLGGVGLALAQYLAKEVSPKLVLTGRSEFPPRDRWENYLSNHPDEDSISQKILKVQEMEKSGAKIMVSIANVTDQQQMKDLIIQAEEHLGQINGIIHCAGIPDGTLIQLRTRENCQRVFAPKVNGTIVLDTVLKDRQLDFFILCSSLDSIMTAPGQVGSCAANIFLNAFAKYKSRVKGTFTLAINWPRWQGVGMAVILENLHQELMGVELTDGMTIREGIDVFHRILGDNLAQVAVNANDLRMIIERENNYQPGTNAFFKEFESMKNSSTVYQRPHLTTQYVPGRNELEETLANIWQNLFGIEQIGIQDDFFELGGDSLKAVIATARIHKELNVEIPLAEFFNNPTIEELARCVNRAEMAAHISIQPVEKKEYYVLSSAQKRLYIQQHMEEGNVAYNMPVIVILEGTLDKQRLQETFQKLIKRHENLKTSFGMAEEQFIQRIHSDVDFAIEYYEKREDEIEELVKNFERPFDLSKVPLLRVRLVKTGETRYILMFDIHHIISDGTSMGIFTREFMALYEGKELAPLRIQYKDFSQWQNTRKGIDTIKKQEEYWLKEFEGDIPILNMPIDYERSAAHTSEGNIITFEIDSEETKGLKEMALGEVATLYMVLLAIFNVLLARQCDQEEIIIGAPTAGRSHVDLEPLIGFFVNMLVLRNFPADRKTFREFLLEVKERTLKAYENQDYQFEELVVKVLKDSESSRNSLIDVIFVFQNQVIMGDKIPEVNIPGLTLKPYKQDIDTSPFDLALNGAEEGKKLTFSLHYRTKRFKKGTIQLLVRNFQEITSAVLDNKNIRLEDINIFHDLLVSESTSLHEEEGDFEF